MVNQLAAGFNVGHWELDQAVARLTAEVKELRSCLRAAERALVGYEAQKLRETAADVAGVRLVVHELTSDDPLNMRELARQLVSEPGAVALLGVGDQKVQLCFARSDDIEIDMVSLVRSTAEILGSRGGGGQPDFAQGGGSLADDQQLDAVLEWTAEKVRVQLERAK
jgi:alanyl-tRNA synthetase